jgi:uncharacterized protein YegP (UPF0339 family)
MSVNIFGSCGANVSSGSNNKYVDQTFKTLSANLATKVNKTGDTTSGNFNILLAGDNLRTFGVPDINTGKSVSLILGNFENQIRHNFGHPIKIAATHGIKFTSPAGDVCKFGSQTDSKSQFLNDINMNGHYIGKLSDPSTGKDAATKNYVDTRYIKNSVGFIPDLVSNVYNKSGFKVSASHDPDNVAFHVFNSWESDEWMAGIKSNFWIQIQCPERIKIHKFALRGKKNNMDKIYNWKLQASNDDIIWDSLYHSHDTYIDNSVSFVNSISSNAYVYFRLFVIEAENEQAGLNYWQLYTLDQLYLEPAVIS